MSQTTFSGPVRSKAGFELDTNGLVSFGTETSTDATLAIAITSAQVVEAIGVFTASHKYKLEINGVFYWIQLDAV